MALICAHNIKLQMLQDLESDLGGRHGKQYLLPYHAPKRPFRGLPT